MVSNTLAERRRRRRIPQRIRTVSSISEAVESIEMSDTESSNIVRSNVSRSAHLSVSRLESDDENDNLLPLEKIIRKLNRKEWAKIVAPVEHADIKRVKRPLLKRISRLFPKFPSLIRPVLDFIENRNSYTIRSYFQFIVWLFYLNIFLFIICFTCIIMPTYIYPNPVDFYNYSMNEYYQTIGLPQNNRSKDQCSLGDVKCLDLSLPISNVINRSNETCLENPYTASACCSLLTSATFLNSSREAERDWTKYLSYLIDGSGFFTVNRLFIGYYRNLTKASDENTFFQTYNMGLAVFLATFACIFISGLLVLRKYGRGMHKSYIKTETFDSNRFQYLFTLWNYRITDEKIATRHHNRYKTEIKHILFERNNERSFKFNTMKERVVFQMKRMLLWLATITIFVAAIVLLYFTNRFSFQEKSKWELDENKKKSNRARDMAIEYLPSAAVSIINLVSQLIFSWMKKFKFYSDATIARHYLFRVILIRLLLLFAQMFITVLQITCNSNQCGLQSELIDCAGIKGQATFIHCWETLIGQVIYRILITNTALMIGMHLIVDLIRSLCCKCCNKQVHCAQDDDTDVNDKANTSGSTGSLEFELLDYVLDLTYTQTLCWHGLLFCPFLPLMAAGQNIITFLIKLFSLSTFRKQSTIEFSPARPRYMFTAVLVLSFIWALLPITFFVTALRPSRGCGPFRLYSDESEYFIYYSVRNLVSQIGNKTIVNIIFEITSSVVIIPIILILILYACVLTIRRNSLRFASQELHKLLRA